MAGEKYIGKIYEGRWKVEHFEKYGQGKSHSGKYVLVNIYNGEERTVKDHSLAKIDRGEMTLSFLTSIKLKKRKRFKW